MKNSLSTGLTLLLATGLVAAQDTITSSTPSAASAGGRAQISAQPITAKEESPILKGAELKTEWASTRNPFRFEVNDGPSYTPERLEQMQVLGFSRMPDEQGVQRTYAFVTKTTDGTHVQDNKAETKVTKDVYILQALPEKLDEETVATEEQIEQCSISLGSEHLWFLGIVQTNGQVLAIFVPDTATYPIKEEDLRPFEMQDSLKNLHVRVTKAGERISAEGNTPRIISRLKGRSTPASHTTPAPAPVSKPATPSRAGEKPTAHGNPDRETDERSKDIGETSGHKT